MAFLRRIPCRVFTCDRVSTRVVEDYQALLGILFLTRIRSVVVTSLVQTRLNRGRLEATAIDLDCFCTGRTEAFRFVPSN